MIIDYSGVLFKNKRLNK